MYCTKCGKALKNNARFCTSCGQAVDGYYEENDGNASKVGDSKFKEIMKQKFQQRDVFNDNDSFVFFNDLNNRKRKLIVVNYIHKALIILSGIIMLGFIYEQVKANEGYKFVVYVIRFFVALSPWLMLTEIFEGIKTVFKCRTSDLSEGCNTKLLLAAIIVQYAFAVISLIPLINPSDLQLGKWFITVSAGGFWDFISCFSFTIVCWIIVVIISVFIQKSMIPGYGDEE